MNTGALVVVAKAVTMLMLLCSLTRRDFRVKLKMLEALSNTDALNAGTVLTVKTPSRLKR